MSLIKIPPVLIFIIVFVISYSYRLEHNRLNKPSNLCEKYKINLEGYLYRTDKFNVENGAIYFKPCGSEKEIVSSTFIIEKLLND